MKEVNNLGASPQGMEKEKTLIISVQSRVLGRELNPLVGLNEKSSSSASIPNVTQMKTPKPIYWKQVLITTLSVYPLLMGSTWFLKLIFPMKELAQEVAIFFTVAMVASLMVFPVMPFLMKLLGSWLYKK